MLQGKPSVFERADPATQINADPDPQPCTQVILLPSVADPDPGSGAYLTP
jgi:hypothetical protein